LLKPYPFSTAVYDREGHLLKLTLTQDEKYRLYTPLSQISKQLIEATLLQEDRYFYRHFGVNPLSLCKAFWQTYVLRSRRVGASTITMQLARLRFGVHSKKISGKFIQLFRALQLERHYSKAEILEAYLNLAPYGSNIEGVGAASLIYFNHSVAKLSLPEALTLSIIPQNPIKRMPNQPALKEIRSRLWSRWLLQHPQDQRQSALFDLPVTMQTRHALPFFAPHFVNMALRAALNPDKRSFSLKTTLDLHMQRSIERVMRQYIARKKPFGVSNATALLLDTRDMGIRALVGSLHFFDTSISGQINGALMKRSPGSTLKPFIYGLALDQGLIHPSTVLKDVPQSFNGYNPENFDTDFMGPIKAKDALILSRNIPAVFLANQLKNPSLYQLLEQAHVRGLRAPSYYGLSLNLGGVELSMRELVELYAMLVNEGLWYPSHLLASESKGTSRRMLSPEASFLVLDMLAQTSIVKLSHNESPAVAFKTGTSSGYRDAWTLGTFGPYVLAVWIGNVNNGANPALIGKEMAAPLFFELIEAINKGFGPIPALDKHLNTLNLKKVAVCKTSGLLPTRYCLDREQTWFIPGVSPIKTDTVFREVAINKKTGLRSCHIDDNTQFEIFEFWPSDLLSIFKRAGIQRHSPPLFEPGCVLTTNRDLSPKMTSPIAGVRYVLRIHEHHQGIPLTAVTDGGIETLYWFINEHFIGKTQADKALLWQATPGRFIVRVVDDHGLSDAREIQVEMDR
jgi:penicillin-binding protein 1C